MLRLSTGPASYYAVAVAKASDDSTRFTKDGLKDKKSCHTGFEKTAGWNFPIGQMFQKGISNFMDPGTDLYKDILI